MTVSTREISLPYSRARQFAAAFATAALLSCSAQAQGPLAPASTQVAAARTRGGAVPIRPAPPAPRQNVGRPDRKSQPAPSAPPPSPARPAPLDLSVPPPSLPRASREKMRACAEEWEKKKLATKTGLPMWRTFATDCLTR